MKLCPFWLSDLGHAAENPNLIRALRESVYGALWSKRTVLAVTPARQPAPLAALSMLFLLMCLIYFETLPAADRMNQKLCTFASSKTAFSGTKRRFAVLKIVWQIVLV